VTPLLGEIPLVFSIVERIAKYLDDADLVVFAHF